MGALAQHDRVGQAVGDCSQRSRELWDGNLLNQVGPPMSGNIPVSALKIAELTGKYMKVPTIPR